MTIREYRQELSTQIERLSTDLKNPISREQITGLRVALNLSEKLYDTYSYNGNNELKLMTNRQLAEVLAKGYGQVKLVSDEEDDCDEFCSSYETVWSYFEEEGADDNDMVPNNVRIRRWGSDKWILPIFEIYENFTQSLPYPFYTNNDTSSNSGKEVIY